jgi:SAM-dependent methyltransferase
MTSANDWSGSIGDVWAEEWPHTDRCLAGLAVHLNAAILDMATPGSATIVDIGCGAGATSLATATALPARRVVGIDISPSLVAIATERAGGLDNLAFRCGPAEDHLADLAPVDLVVSRHGVMFFPDPVAAFSALRSGTVPGGGLVFSCFRPAALNPWATELVSAVAGEMPPPPTGYVPGPFAFADPDFVRDILGKAGWSRINARPVDFAYRAGQGTDPVGDALRFLQRIGPAAALLRQAPAEERTAMLARVEAVIARHCSGDVVDFPAAAWLWSAHNDT